MFYNNLGHFLQTLWVPALNTNPHVFDPSQVFFRNKVFLRGVFIDFLWFSSVFLSNKQSGHSGHLGHLGPSGAIWAIWGHPGPPGLREKCAERHCFYDGWRFSPQTQNRLFPKKQKQQTQTKNRKTKKIQKSKKNKNKTTNPLARVVRVLQHLRPCLTNPV